MSKLDVHQGKQEKHIGKREPWMDTTSIGFIEVIRMYHIIFLFGKIYFSI